MLGREFKRLLFSYRTVVMIVVAFLLTMISYYYTRMEYLGLKELLLGGAGDVNTANVAELAGNYNGFYYLFAFYNKSDEFMIMIIALFAWIGIFVSVGLFNRKETGYGNFLIVRSGYKKYHSIQVMAQTIYIAVVLGIVVVMQLVTAIFFGTEDFNGFVYGQTHLGVFGCLGLVFGIWLTAAFYCICINIIVSSLECFIRNRYFLQAIPVMIFVMAPILIGSTLENIFNWTTFGFDIVNPFSYMGILFRVINYSGASERFISEAISVVVFLMAGVIFYRINEVKMRRNYL